MRTVHRIGTVIAGALLAAAGLPAVAAHAYDPCATALVGPVRYEVTKSPYPFVCLQVGDLGVEAYLRLVPTGNGDTSILYAGVCNGPAVNPDCADVYGERTTSAGTSPVDVGTSGWGTPASSISSTSRASRSTARSRCRACRWGRAARSWSPG